ncbi:phosphotransferase family protein [Paenibacillus sp. JCM 10914]|uniref:phosphotransferase family protein n=1 Tax=Paenibacillus sp. JCM 10914 TaxID=1236974 RepID=UPI00351C1319
MIRNIPGSDGWITIKELNKGWSRDRKYYVQDTEHNEWLLRLSDISQHERKQWEFEHMKQLDANKLRIPRPVAFGVCDAGEQVYTLLSWVHGEDIRDVLPSLNQKDQYQLGIQAGQSLRAMHEIPAPSGLSHGQITMKPKWTST